MHVDQVILNDDFNSSILRNHNKIVQLMSNS